MWGRFGNTSQVLWKLPVSLFSNSSGPLDQAAFACCQARSFAKKAREREQEAKFHVEFAPVVVEDPDKIWRPSRYRQYYENIVKRELLVKLGAPSHADLPELKMVTLSVASEDLPTPREYAEKWEMLTSMLALEHLGLQPVQFVQPPLKYYRGRVVGVKSELTGDNMYDFLEKLVHVVLPAETEFEGVPMPTRVKLESRFKYLYATELKVPKLLLYPDFAENFDLFQATRGMQVRIEIGNTKSRWAASLLLTSLGLPIIGHSPSTRALVATPST